MKKSDISMREISAMEIDDVELPESDVKFEEEDMVVDLMVIILLPSVKTNNGACAWVIQIFYN